MWQGQLVSNIGTNIATVALMFWIKRVTGSATLMGLSMMVYTFTYALATPIGGTLADRFSRKKILVISDSLAGIVSILLATAMFIELKVWILCVCIILAQFIYGCFQAFFYPTINASLPTLVPKKDLDKANTAKNSAFQLGLLFGQGFGGGLFQIFGAPLIFLFNGISYLFSALSESFITIPVDYLKHKTKNQQSPLKQFRDDTKEGIQYLWKQKGVKNLVFMMGISYFFIGPFITLLPFFIEDILKLPPFWYGIIFGGFGFGAFVGFVLASNIKVPGKIRSKIIYVTYLVYALVTGLFGFVGNGILATGIMVMGGLIVGYYTIAYETGIQLRIPDHLRGRVFGAIGTVSACLMPLGQFFSGIIADITDKNVSMIFLFSGICLLITTFILLTKRSSLEVLEYDINDTSPKAKTEKDEASEQDEEVPELVETY